MSEKGIERRSKVMNAQEAVSLFVTKGCFLAVGGMHMHNNPMGVIREIVKQNRRIGTLITSPSANINADMLIGADLVDELISPYIGFEHLGLSYNYRNALKTNKIRVRESDEGLVVYGLRAGAASIPFIPYPKGVDQTDVPRINSIDFRKLIDPFTGDEVTAVKAINPDVCVIHCQKSDIYGNGIFEGSRFTDLEMALASNKIIVMTDELVSERYITTNPMKTGIPSCIVDAVVPIPFGCHPTSSHTKYTYDEEHLKEYIEMSRADFESYLNKYVRSPRDNDEYLDLVGGSHKLELLIQGGTILW